MKAWMEAALRLPGILRFGHSFTSSTFGPNSLDLTNIYENRANDPSIHTALSKGGHQRYSETCSRLTCVGLFRIDRSFLFCNLLLIAATI
ncbi:MAG TPA: hypothetical protein VIW67_27535, partial [Terriglobales bacterium]